MRNKSIDKLHLRRYLLFETEITFHEFGGTAENFTAQALPGGFYRHWYQKREGCPPQFVLTHICKGVIHVSKSPAAVSPAPAHSRLARRSAGEAPGPGRRTLWQRICTHWQLYLLLLIPVVLTVIYKYVPIYGIQIAFRNYTASRGIWGSEFVGWQWFQRFFTSPNCWRMIKNTFLLSLYSLLWSFPVPIILSLAINQLRFKRFRRVVQTVLYAPHFISVMVICGMLRIFLSPTGGLINLLLGTSVDFLSQSSAFRTIYIASDIWQDAGWGTIVYLATLSNVDIGLYEAAKIDGASMFQRILKIDLPELLPTAMLMLVMSAGNLMNIGFEKVWLLQTDLNKATSDVIAVYVYEQGIQSAAYSYSTAVSLFNTVINLILLLVVNKVASKISDVSFT